MTNAELARALARIGTLLEIDGANVFRVRAYREGARIVEAHEQALAGLVDEPGALEALPGIGKGIAQNIRELTATGHTPLMDELLAKYPEEVVGFTELQGLGPKRVRTLFDTLGITTRAALAEAAAAGRLRDLPGFGEKVEQTVIKAIATAAAFSGRMLLAEVWPLAHALRDAILAVRGVTQVELAGSFRRRRDTVGDLDRFPYADNEVARRMRARVATDPGACTSATCRRARECFWARARRRAAEAKLVIVNHALLARASDAEGILPP